VRGPIIVSRSIHDRAVGVLYPWASAISLSDGSFEVDEDNLPLYGAIGAFGIRGLPDAIQLASVSKGALASPIAHRIPGRSRLRTGVPSDRRICR